MLTATCFTYQHITCLVHHRTPETPNTVCLEGAQECGLETMTFHSLAWIPTHLQIVFLQFYAQLHHSPQKDAINNDKNSERVC